MRIKELLQEEPRTDKIEVAFIYNLVNLDRLVSLSQKVKKEIADLLPGYTLEFISGKDKSSTVRLLNVPIEQLTQADIDEIAAKIRPVLAKEFMMSEKSLKFLEINSVTVEGIPSVKINFKLIVMMFFRVKNVSLSGIQKVISCHALSILGARNVGSGVLSLLQTDAKHLNISGNPGWEKIIEKHFNGDKDVLECQEELIEAGFEEVATL